MAVGINRWYGIGNMTADPKLKQGDTEDRDRCEFSIAINKPPGRSGQDSEVLFLDFVTWGKLANQVNEFGRKGRLVFCDGELEVRRWEDQETGEKKKIYRIKAYVVRFLDRRDEAAAEDERPARRDAAPAPTPRQPTGKASDFDDLPW